jgi:hypothetical protein
MTQISNTTFMKSQVAIIKKALNEIDMHHYNSINPDVSELLMQIAWSADEIRMTLEGKNYVGEPEKHRERN